MQRAVVRPKPDRDAPVQASRSRGRPSGMRPLDAARAAGDVTVTGGRREAGQRMDRPRSALTRRGTWPTAPPSARLPRCQVRRPPCAVATRASAAITSTSGRIGDFPPRPVIVDFVRAQSDVWRTTKGGRAMGKRANGEGSVYQRTDGRWCASVTTERGRQHFLGRTRAEVARKLTGALDARDKGTLVTGPRQTVEPVLLAVARRRASRRSVRARSSATSSSSASM